MSPLTAAETLNSGEVASLPKRWISLSGGERCSWRSRRLVCPTSNRSHLISHHFSEGKHLRQRWRDRRLRNPLSGPLRAIHRGEHLLRVLVFLYCKGLFRRSIYIYGRAKAGTICTHLNQCLEFPALLGTNHHPQVLFELRIRLSAHKLLSDQPLAELRRALWVANPA